MDDSYEIGHRLIVVVPDKTAEAMREVQMAQVAPEESFVKKSPIQSSLFMVNRLQLLSASKP